MIISLCLIYTVNPVTVLYGCFYVCTYVCMYVRKHILQVSNVDLRMDPQHQQRDQLCVQTTCNRLQPTGHSQNLLQSWFPILKPCSLLNRILPTWNPLFPLVNLKLLLMDLVYHLCTSPKLGFQRFKRNYRGKQNHTKMNVTQHCALQRPCWPRQTLSGPQRASADWEVACSRTPGQMSLRGVKMLSPAILSSAAACLEASVFTSFTFHLLVFN